MTTGFSKPQGAIYDGANVWVTDLMAGTLLKLDSAGAILQTVAVGSNPRFPVFDGTSIWVPNSATNSVSVVRASSGVVLQTLTGNGLDFPLAAAFDGQRVLVTNFSGQHCLALEGGRPDAPRLFLDRREHEPRRRLQRRPQLLDLAEQREQARPLLTEQPIVASPAR